LNSSELTGIIEQNYHSKLSEAQARNSNELTDKFEINCHSGRFEAKTRNPGGTFLKFVLSLNGFVFIQAKPAHFPEADQ